MRFHNREPTDQGDAETMSLRDEIVTVQAYREINDEFWMRDFLQKDQIWCGRLKHTEDVCFVSLTAIPDIVSHHAERHWRLDL